MTLRDTAAQYTIRPSEGRHDTEMDNDLPSVRSVQSGRISLANLHQNSTWIHVVVRRLHLCHLDQRNA